MKEYQRKEKQPQMHYLARQGVKPLAMVYTIGPDGFIYRSRPSSEGFDKRYYRR